MSSQRWEILNFHHILKLKFFELVGIIWENLKTQRLKPVKCNMNFLKRRLCGCIYNNLLFPVIITSSRWKTTFDWDFFCLSVVCGKYWESKGLGRRSLKSFFRSDDYTIRWKVSQKKRIAPNRDGIFKWNNRKYGRCN